MRRFGNVRQIFTGEGCETMKRELIDRAAALQIMADAGQEYHEDGDFVRFVSAVINMQTAAARIVALPTVEERRRGWWKVYTDEGGFAHLECSACGGWMLAEATPFCPYCGAEMENSGKEPAQEE